MKTLIISLNSKYIHSALAPWYLKAACGDTCGEVRVAEYTINEGTDTILAAIYSEKPDIAAFSCYIWNIAQILKLAESLKKLLPNTVIVLGGPEVSYDAGELLEKHEYIDFILAGEGEDSFPQLIRLTAAAGTTGALNVKSRGGEQQPWLQIDGIACRTGEGIAVRAPAQVKLLDRIPSPYTEEMLSSLKNRIVYFETSRGCPYSCSYCLSSATEGTRYFSLERVFEDLERLISAGVRQIKFVDRTFNFHRKRSLEIVRHIIELDRAAGSGGSNCNFHFVVGADLFDEELLQLLEGAPEGLFQLEAGVQSANEQSLKAVCRKTNLETLFTNLDRLLKGGNNHIHADLIAGLPHEDYSSFGLSFDSLYHVRPHQLQLGFLKFLKGTRLRRDAANDGYRYTGYPPYEVLEGPSISYDELILLKGIAQLTDRFYNSARFVFSLDFIIDRYYTSPFRFYEDLFTYHKNAGKMDSHPGVRELYAILYDFASTIMNAEDRATLGELLRVDFLASDNTGTLPDYMDKRLNAGFHDRCFEFLRDSETVAGSIPEAAGMTPKQVFKKVRFEPVFLELVPSGVFPFKYNAGGNTVLLFNYMSRNKVTGRYRFCKINL